MPRSLLLSSALALACAANATAQVRAGAEFRANTFTTDEQVTPAIAPLAGGGFVVVWASYPQEGGYGFGYGVFGQRYDADGATAGAEFHVNTYTTWAQYAPAVAADARGNFVVVWYSTRGQDGDDTGNFGQRFGRTGQRLGPEFLVNSYTTGGQLPASVVMAPDGSFIAAWTGAFGQAGSGFDDFAQRFDPSGGRRGAEFRVNAYTTGLQGGSSVAADAGGGFVVVWSDYGQDGFYFGVSGRRFDASGTPLTGDFRVNTFTFSNQYSAVTAAAPSGAFVVVWSSYGQDGSRLGVFGQRFDAAGDRAGGEFQVNVYTDRQQATPAVAMDAAGNFVVAWTSSGGQDGNDYGVFARRYDAAGNPRSGEFQVNTYTTNLQAFPEVASDTVGNFVVAWASLGQDGTSYQDVFAQRFGGLLPAALAVDTSGNRVLEPGESVDVRPSWLNVNGAPQTFTSKAVAFTGPPGTAYTITDATAAYGTVGNGVTAPCSDCLGVSTATAGTRPVTHWDATLEERITPDAQGQDKPWSLHLGDSFTDVPPTNPFYRFVETLLHHSVTAGCSATAYCPSNATAREQMAVFVLVAKEGAGHSPPACTTPMFNDVPASSPFCRWVEELARRGVVSGCGGGNYCPGSPVTREQMSVFVLRTLDPALDPPACTTPMFGDVPASSSFCRWIEELARRGVVTGCGGGNYCPSAPVSRDQTGVFIAVTFGLELYGP